MVRLEATRTREDPLIETRYDRSLTHRTRTLARYADAFGTALATGTSVGTSPEQQDTVLSQLFSQPMAPGDATARAGPWPDS